MRLREPLDDRTTWSTTGRCPIEKAMGVVGSRNAMLIMREAFYGTTRYDDFAKRVEMAPATAASNLKALTDAGLLQRRPYRDPGERTRDEYVLTAAGADLMPVLIALYQWGSRHAGTPPLLEFVHAGCGQQIDTYVHCTHGHDVADDQIELRRVPRHKSPNRRSEGSPR
jgi:DNA-binding HxlR family transcriptional regulator